MNVRRRARFLNGPEPRTAPTISSTIRSFWSEFRRSALGLTMIAVPDAAGRDPGGGCDRLPTGRQYTRRDRCAAAVRLLVSCRASGHDRPPAAAPAREEESVPHGERPLRQRIPYRPRPPRGLRRLPPARPAAVRAAPAERPAPPRRDAVPDPASGGGALVQADRARTRGGDGRHPRGRPRPRGEDSGAGEAGAAPALQPVGRAGYAHAQRIRRVPPRVRPGLRLPVTPVPAGGVHARQQGPGEDRGIRPPRGVAP